VIIYLHGTIFTKSLPAMDLVQKVDEIVEWIPDARLGPFSREGKKAYRPYLGWNAPFPNLCTSVGHPSSPHRSFLNVERESPPGAGGRSWVNDTVYSAAQCGNPPPSRLSADEVECVIRVQEGIR